VPPRVPSARLLEEQRIAPPSEPHRAETIETGSSVSGPGGLDFDLSTAGSPLPPPIVFERIEPSSMRGNRVFLDPAKAQIRVGRSKANEFRLYSAWASRKHAIIERNFTGHWVMTPYSGRGIKVDEQPMTEPVVLEVGMHLVLGGDHFRCVPEEGLRDRDDNNPETSRRGQIGFNGSRAIWGRRVLFAVVVLAIGLDVRLWFQR